MQVHGGDIYGKGPIIDFSSNINPLGIPACAMQILNKIDILTYYPDEESNELTESIALYLDVQKENVLVGNGLSEIIRLIMSGLGIKKPVIIGPTFDEYRLSAMAYDAFPHMYYLTEDNNFNASKIDLSDLEFDAVFICNPNNPTGRLYAKNLIEDLLSQVKDRNAYFIIDEAFMEFCFDMGYTMIDYLPQYEKLIVMRAATKFFGMPGLRLGYAVSAADVIHKLKRIQPSWPLNSFASHMSPIFLDKAYIKETKEWMQNERPYMKERLDAIKGIHAYPSDANFFMIKLESISALDLKTRMIEKGFLIRDLSNIPGLNNGFIRVAVKTRELNDKLLDTLEVTLNG
ncbi:MAG: histidinol-phosphate transaminase [Thermoanaerobacteraceae bacterium]|nr:histidinol-phosphate transaminase [Thermoanaerobacteraceae bacterium]